MATPYQLDTWRRMEEGELVAYYVRCAANFCGSRAPGERSLWRDTVQDVWAVLVERGLDARARAAVKGETMSDASTDETDRIKKALAAPFGADEIKWKPAVVREKRALALAYVDARAIQDRLDEVLSVDGWQDDYECLADGSVVCRLRLKIGGEWIIKVDVGSPSEQPDGGDRLKAAFSDALKRAAVKFGIGRHLYRLPQQWVGYDPQKRQFTERPRLPGEAAAAPAKASPAPAQPAAPVAPPRDPAELLDEADRRALVQELAGKKRQWAAVAAWLSQCGDSRAAGVTPATPIKDITYGCLALIREALAGKHQKAAAS